MTDTQQTEALRLADRIKSSGQFTNLGELDAAAAELHRLHAENVALQQCYDAARLEIDHLRGAKKSKLLAQPVAWMVYLPSIDTQHLYYSQEDMGYVDDVTNHADAEVTPLYEMAAPKAEVVPAGEYPPLPAKQALYVFKGKDGEREEIHGYDELQMWGFVDADRAPADSVTAPASGATSKNLLQVQAWVIPDGNGGGQFSWQKQDERYWTRLTSPAQVADSVLEDALTDSYVQQVPDKCDRIVWRGNYYHLPTDAARAQAKEGDQHG